MKPDHAEADCPMLLPLDRVANKWAVLVMAALWKSSRRRQATSIPPSTTTTWPVVNSLRIRNR